jgi:UDP-N-acetylglucosamine 2-epimerase (non-hydrolysing)
MKRVSVIFGTRPEAIKLAPVVKAIRAAKIVDCQICVTGQHKEMLRQILEAFDITPDADLQLMTPGQTLPAFTARAISAVDEYLASTQPNLVVVQGDTTSVLAASLTAFYHRIPVAHVEAGLRTFNMYSPWPEEANRVLTSRLATIHFAPTASNRDNLLKEGILSDCIFVTGNTVIDALLQSVSRLASSPVQIPSLPPLICDSTDSPRIVLITGHRRENFGEGFTHICRSIARLAAAFPTVHFVYPVHLNPNVQTVVHTELSNRKLPLPNIHLIPPLDYLPFVSLMQKSEIILTDSGGVQEEAPSLGKPVLVLRDTTERPEAVLAGSVKVIGTNPDAIYNATSRLLLDASARQAMARVRNPYGDGHAAERIADVCHSFLAKNSNAVLH